MSNLYLSHHGIKGQRWGVRRFQNDDGTLTSSGKKRYDVNSDGTANLKDGFRKNQNTKGGIKTAIGTALLAKSVENIVGAKKQGYSTEKGRKTLNRAIFTATLGTVVIASGVKNFISANKNRTINTVGMGGTPEGFIGKAKTRAQVLRDQEKQNSK